MEEDGESERPLYGNDEKTRDAEVSTQFPAELHPIFLGEC